MVHSWYIKKMKEQQHANINIESVGLAALKQHSEKIKRQGFSSHLTHSLTGHETDPTADTGIE